MASIKQSGECNCGKVKFAVDCGVMFNAFCHCKICARGRGTSPVHLIGVAPDDVKITEGTVKTFTKKGATGNDVTYAYCGECSTEIYHGPKGAPFRAISPANFHIEDGKSCLLPDDLKPQVHLNYENRTFDVFDSLPKYKDFPAGFGGSDVLLENENSQEAMGGDSIKQSGECNCGKVKFALDCGVMFNGLCHCKICTRGRGTSAVHLIGVAPDDLKITEGTDFLKTFTKKGATGKDVTYMNCSECNTEIHHGPVGAPFRAISPTNFHIEDGKVCLLPADLMPKVHLNYENRLFDASDNLPKYKDFPAGFGGSDVLLTAKGEPVAAS